MTAPFTMLMMRCCWVWLSSILLTGILSFASAAEEGLHFLRLGTGVSSGSYFTVGASIANLVSNPPGSRPCEKGGSCGVPGLIASAQSTAGSLENIRAIQRGALESGLAQADLTAWAFRGSAALSIPPTTNLRALASLYPDALHIVVRADSALHTLAALKGQRLSLGDSASGSAMSTRLVLEAAGVPLSTLRLQKLSATKAAESLEKKTIDAFVVIGGAPMPLIRSLDARVPLRFLSLEESDIAAIRARYAWWTPYLIKRKVYGRIPSVRTVALNSVWLVSAGLSDETAYGLVRALWHPDALRVLGTSHPTDGMLRLDKTLFSIPIPLHPGAELFYRQAGVLHDETEASHSAK